LHRAAGITLCDPIILCTCHLFFADLPFQTCDPTQPTKKNSRLIPNPNPTRGSTQPIDNSHSPEKGRSLSVIRLLVQMKFRGVPFGVHPDVWVCREKKGYANQL